MRDNQRIYLAFVDSGREFYSVQYLDVLGTNWVKNHSVRHLLSLQIKILNNLIQALPLKVCKDPDVEDLAETVLEISVQIFHLCNFF